MSEQPNRRELVRALLRLAGIAVGLLGLYLLLPLEDDNWWLALTVGLLAVFAVIPLTIRRLRAVRVAAQPALVAAEGLVLMIVLTIVGFSTIYLTLARWSGQFNALDTKVDAMYFTIVTLATVGFGDIVATGQVARVAVMVQIMLNLSLIAVASRAIINTAQRRVESRR